jgi:hypothetical protein
MKRDRQFWAVHVAAIEREGIPVNAYAKRESISLAAIYYWKAKLRVPAEVCGAAKPAGAFVQLRVADSVGARIPAGCTLVLASGVCLEMAGLPAPEWLASLVRATREVF